MVRSVTLKSCLVDRRMEESEDDYNERLVVAAVQYFNEHFSVEESRVRVTFRAWVSTHCW